MNYRFLRSAHKWVGLFCSLVLMSIAITGFLLALKGKISWMRPPEMKGAEISGPAEIVAVEKVVEAAFAVGIAELQTMKDIDRVDYRPKHNVFKVVSKKGFHEVQVDGKTGEVLQTAKRNDTLTEQIHDLSLFADWTKDYVLPVVAVVLFLLSLSGVVMFFIPVFKRWDFKRKNPGAK